MDTLSAPSLLQGMVRHLDTAGLYALDGALHDLGSECFDYAEQYRRDGNEDACTYYRRKRQQVLAGADYVGGILRQVERSIHSREV